MPDSSAEKRAAYIAILEEVLAARDLVTEVRERLTEVTRDYPDTLHLHEILDGVEAAPSAPSKGIRRQQPTGLIDSITVGLVTANPGRTTHQLLAAMHRLPLDEQFYDSSLSPCLTNLRRDGKVVGALCDTERKVKYYVMGEVPSTAMVFDGKENLSGISHAQMKDRARKPTQKETGKGLEVIGPHKRRAS